MLNPFSGTSGPPRSTSGSISTVHSLATCIIGTRYPSGSFQFIFSMSGNSINHTTNLSDSFSAGIGFFNTSSLSRTGLFVSPLLISFNQTINSSVNLSFHKLYDVNFVEHGLPSLYKGCSPTWNISLQSHINKHSNHEKIQGPVTPGRSGDTSIPFIFGGNSFQSCCPSRNISMYLTNGTYSYNAISNVPHYTDPSTFTVSGSNENITANYVYSYNDTINETGLPSGTPWTINITGKNYSSSFTSNTSSMAVPLGNGTFNYSSITSGIYAAPAGTISISGNATFTNIVFKKVIEPVTFSEFGLAKNTTWTVTFNGLTKSSSSSNISFSSNNGTFSFSIHTVPGYRNVLKGNITVSGPTSEKITFTSVKYQVSFRESGLPTSMQWSLSLNGQIQNSTSGTISFSEPNGSYSYTVGSTKGYISSTPSGTIDISGASLSTPLLFSQIVVQSSIINITMGFGTNAKNFVPVEFLSINSSSGNLPILSQYLTGNQSEFLMIEIHTTMREIHLKLTLYGNKGIQSPLGAITGEEIGYFLGAVLIFGGAFLAMPWHDIRIKIGGKRQ